MGSNSKRKPFFSATVVFSASCLLFLYSANGFAAILSAKNFSNFSLNNKYLKDDEMATGGSYFEFSKVDFVDNVRQERNQSDYGALKLDKSWHKDNLSLQVAFNTRYFFNQKQAAFSLQEFYGEYKNDNNSLSIGRKIINWNDSEKFWLLGHLNGLSSLDFLNKENEGLFGIHYQFNIGPRIVVESFLSYFYVPSLNPMLDVKDGKVVNNGSWGRTPPTYTGIAGIKKPINYQLNRPRNQDIVFKKTLGARINFKGFLNLDETSFYAIYKPENTLRVNAVAYGEKTADVTAIANPIVNHHAIYGASSRMGVGSFKGKIGIQQVDPNANLAGDFEVLDPFELQQEKRTFTSEFFSVKPNYQKQTYSTLDLTFERPSFKLTFHHIYLLEGRDAGGDDFLSDAPRWHHAFGASGSVLYRSKIYLGSSYHYDVQRQDQILTFNGAYVLDTGFSLGGSAKMLRSPEIQSYWYPYRAEDQVSFFIQKAF